ncbi:MAG TPA: histidine--tRNA ligase [Longimicrobiales bacterium]|nr:histidine--tRNA ligase [Longimicrobiales bacterium]
MTFQSLPGFRDFFPAEYAVRHHIQSAWRESARRYGFEEYDGPPLEPLELYVEKSGEEIVEQLYAFEDKGGRKVALRPEMTPTLARMIGEHGRSLPKPIRWFSIPQLFRYERTQRGRLREHFQWNVDVIGESDIAADAEVLAVALDGLTALGLGSGDIVARVNDRRLVDALLARTGVDAERREGAYAAIDKMSREESARTRDRLKEHVGLDAETIEGVLAVFDMDLAGLRTAHGDDGAVAAALDRLDEYFRLLDDMGWGQYVTFDPRIVRGLAYYTGTVFEIFDRAGELRAICGGGRYDGLLAAVSDLEMPAVGFGMGDVVLGELLRDCGLLPDAAEGPDIHIVTITEAERPLLRRMARSLRAEGRSVSYTLRQLGVGKQFKDANARGAGETIVLGPDEVAQGVAVVRSMGSGEERRVPLVELGG